MSVDLTRRIRALADKLRQLRSDKAKAEAQLTTLNSDIHKIETQSLPLLLQQASLTAMEFDEGSWNIKLTSIIQASIPKEQKNDAFNWLEAHGYGGIIKSELSVAFSKEELKKAQTLAKQLAGKGFAVEFDRSVHTGTLKAWVRERLRKGEDVPNSIEYIDIPTVVISKERI